MANVRMPDGGLSAKKEFVPLYIGIYVELTVKKKKQQN